MKKYTILASALIPAALALGLAGANIASANNDAVKDPSYYSSYGRYYGRTSSPYQYMRWPMTRQMLQNHLQTWVSQGFISQDQANRIIQYEQNSRQNYGYEGYYEYPY